MTVRARRLLLLLITALAAVLRLGWMGQSPPGLNQDEAISAWISWCLLKTGRDLVGQPWPLFYSHGIGDYPSTLFFYTLMPFQALGGLGALTTRLPAALAGIAAVPVLYYVGARMFGPAAGLLAAALLAVNPWHLFLSRIGIGASQCPLYALLPVALMLKAGLPLSDAPQRTPDVRWAVLAGLAAGISCYGFHPMRLYFPALFFLFALFLAPAWLRLGRTPPGRNAILGFVLGFGLAFGPLAWLHLTDPRIAHRWEMTRLWAPGTPLAGIIGVIARRWAEHFHPDFLFVRGDLFEIVKPIGQGEFSWYMLPLMAAGLVFLVLRMKTSRAARALLAMLIAYPAGDVISRYISVHALRSAPGVGALVLLGAWGACESGIWLRRQSRLAYRIASVALLLAAVALEGRYLARHFGAWNRQPSIYHAYHADLLEVAEWLAPKLHEVDAVFCTVTGLNQPWSIMAVGTRHDPRLWLSEPRDRRALEYDIYLRYGKMHFMYGDLWVPYLNALRENGRQDRVLFIVRPGELGLSAPLHAVRRPDGTEALWVVGQIH